MSITGLLFGFINIPRYWLQHKKRNHDSVALVLERTFRARAVFNRQIYDCGFYKLMQRNVATHTFSTVIFNLSKHKDI